MFLQFVQLFTHRLRLCHVTADAVNHCRHRLLLLVPRFIIPSEPQKISHGNFKPVRWMGSTYYGAEGTTTWWQRPSFIQMHDRRVREVMSLCSHGCVHLQDPRTGRDDAVVENWLSVSPQWGACREPWLYAAPDNGSRDKIHVKQQHRDTVLHL